MSEVTQIRREAAPLEDGADILVNASELPQQYIVDQTREAAALAIASPNSTPVTATETITIVSAQTLFNRRQEVEQYRIAA
jgi:hypothetical protein